MLHSIEFYLIALFCLLSSQGYEEILDPHEALKEIIITLLLWYIYSYEHSSLTTSLFPLFSLVGLEQDG